MVKKGKTMSVIPQHAFKAEDIIKSGRTTRSNVDDIKKWLKFKPYIPELSDEQIVLFLIACQNNIEVTQYTIECYFNYKFSYPEMFSNRDVDSEQMQHTYRVTKFAISPKRTKNNYVVGFAMLRDTYYYNYNLEQQSKVLFSLVDVALHSGPPDGLVFIINMKGVGLMHVTRMKIGAVRKFLCYLQEAFPIQLRQVHILNASYVFEKILTILKPFMKKELFDMIIPHSPAMPMEDFFEKYVPASCMPSDLGGELPTLDQLSEDTQNECRKLKTFLEMEEKQVQLYKKEK
ncbi:retinaldehyde-binding protein 1-like isoform X2 [Anoplophora glabripennis]|uniref:retinaldehyde-binding protein 1-like isoform X2 n=1 Tax=Anoplophora glabripennis TaxID=217634 RepID=UPI000C78AF34|nr:retinaldehyde-binding protein 1-like isoform X2 [Anoplophora glabripennis]